jgi:hypothetical protein
MLMLFVFFEFGFIAAAMLFAAPVLQALAWPAVLWRTSGGGDDGRLLLAASSEPESAALANNTLAEDVALLAQAFDYP